MTNYEEVLPIICEGSTSNIPYEKSVLAYKENSKYGLIDFDGKKITNPIYDEITSLQYREGCLKVKKGDKYGIINMNGHEIIKIAYEDVKSDEFYTKENEYMGAGFIIQIKTEEGYRYGYANKNGKEVLKTEYNDISRITEIENLENAYLLISKNGKYGVKENRKTILPIEYEQIDFIKECNVFIVQKDSKQGIISMDGNVIVPISYDSVLCSKNKITTRKGESIEIFNLKGEKLDLKYENITQTENENYCISINDDGKYGITTPNGQLLIKNEYNNLEYAFDTYFIATKEEKVGVIDLNEGIVINFDYDIIQKVKEKNTLQAIISNINKIDIYNNKMEKQLSLKNVNLSTYDNYIKLISEFDISYLDNNGNLIDNKTIFTNNKLFSYKNENGDWGFVDKNNNIVVKPQYDLVTEFNQYGFAGVKLDNKWGVVNEEGRLIVKPTYSIDWNEPEFISKYCKSNFGYGFEYYTDELVK